MTSAPDSAALADAHAASKLAAPELAAPEPDAPALRLVGSSGAVCVDGVCSIEPAASASGQEAVDPS